MNPQTHPLSDSRLYQLCRNYGANALRWRWKFAGLLPEVFKRKLYEKKGYSSIFEFAAKLAGMSEEQVRKVLNLERKFEKCAPLLKSLLEEGTVSPNKLVKIASIATSENQEILANQVQILSQSAIETFVRDEKLWQKIDKNGDAKGEDFNDANGLQKELFSDESVRAQLKRESSVSDVKLLQLDEQVLQELLELQQKGIDINQIIREALEKREQKIVEEKEGLVELSKQGNVHKKPSRYIPVRIKRVIQAEQGTKCSMPRCSKSAEQLHHTQRFALSQSHDPRYLAQLCKEHHQIAHSIDVRACEVRRR